MRARGDGQTGRPIQAITQTGLTQTVYKLLRDKIVNHDYAPGERLQLDTLSRQLAVSRTPVRDALNQLAAEGLVEIQPRRGTFVARVDRETVTQLYQMRLMIDTSVGKLLARQLTPHQIRLLTRLVDKLEKLVDGDSYVDHGAYLECDRAFHSAIVRLLGNARLTALYEEINLPLWLVRAQRDAGAPHDARASLAEHQAILHALADRDPLAAAEAMSAHIESSLSKLDAQFHLDSTPPHRGRLSRM
jgi:GntR family transcriptional regulator, rspAB operon transcriptional repressor